MASINNITRLSFQSVNEDDNIFYMAKSMERQPTKKILTVPTLITLAGATLTFKGLKDGLDTTKGSVEVVAGVQLAIDKFRQTRDKEWPTMDPIQKAGAVGASTLSLARLVREVAKFGQDDTARGWTDTVGDAASAATDGLDGLIARGTDGATAFGGVTDQLIGDKMTRWVKESSMARRGRMSWIHPAVRLVRDLAVTSYREKVTRETDGRVSVDATSKNNPLSGKYSTVDYLVSNALIDSPIGAKMPRWLRETVATITDLHVVATGIANVYHLRQSARKLSDQ